LAIDRLGIAVAELLEELGGGLLSAVQVEIVRNLASVGEYRVQLNQTVVGAFLVSGR